MKYPVHVLCVMSTLDRGGAESMVMSLFRKIDKEKVLFDFVKHTNQIGAYEDEIKELGGKIYIAPRYKIINHLAYRRWWREFLELHPEYKLIHGHFFTISAVYFKVAQSLSRITIGHSHSTENIKNKKEKPVFQPPISLTFIMPSILRSFVLEKSCGIYIEVHSVLQMRWFSAQLQIYLM